MNFWLDVSQDHPSATTVIHDRSGEPHTREPDPLTGDIKTICPPTCQRLPIRLVTEPDGHYFREFLDKNPGVKAGATMFVELKPDNVRRKDGSTCLCPKHQQMEMSRQVRHLK